MKWRNSKERELLSNGGTREQTLPTKNNPNPGQFLIRFFFCKQFFFQKTFNF